MQRLDNNAGVPLYRQLYNELKHAIDSGWYKSGERLPSEDQLCEMFDVSRITVRKALDWLAEDKILIKYHGKGSYVMKTEYIEDPEAGGSFTKSCLLMDTVPSTRILNVDLIEASHEIGRKLELEESKEMIIIKRLRCINEVPVIIENDYFSNQYQFLLTLDLKNCSLHQILWEKAGIRLYRFKDIIDIQYASAEQSQFLNCEIGYPLLRVNELFHGANMQVVYYNEQAILTDQYKYALKSIISHG